MARLTGRDGAVAGGNGGVEGECGSTGTGRTDEVVAGQIQNRAGTMPAAVTGPGTRW